MQTITNCDRPNNLIGQKYQVVSSSTQTPSSNKLPIIIETALTLESTNKLTRNILLLKCLMLISILFKNSDTEGLEEAAEALQNMVEYYQDSNDNYLQTNLPQNLEIINGTILPSKVRPPLILDFE
jgi:hypothetical protein